MDVLKNTKYSCRFFAHIFPSGLFYSLLSFSSYLSIPNYYILLFKVDFFRSSFRTTAGVGVKGGIGRSPQKILKFISQTDACLRTFPRFNAIFRLFSLPFSIFLFPFFPSGHSHSRQHHSIFIIYTSDRIPVLGAVPRTPNVISV